MEIITLFLHDTIALSGTVMCYGQTGAGKTFTITGSTESYQNRGVIPRAISQLFKELNERSDCATVVRSRLFCPNLLLTGMWTNAQPDGRPAEHRWRPLFNAAKFG